MEILYKNKYYYNYNKFIFENNDKPWDYFYLYQNKFILLQEYYNSIINQNKNKKIHYNELCIDTTLSIKNVIKNNKYNWSWEYICANSKIDWLTIKKYNNIFKNWIGISYNPNISFEIIKNNINLPWNWQMISRNKMKNAINNYIKRESNVTIFMLLNRLITNDDLINIILQYYH